nr:reverse transcriptase domain-containing protein [Tanacetum cinerariifolium]
MSSSNYPFIVPSNFDIEDNFSSANTPDYTSASPDYFSALSGNTSPNLSNDLTKDLSASLAFSPFHDDPYMKVIQAYDVTNNELPIPPQAPIALPTILPPSPIFQRKQIGHDDEIVLSHVKTSTLEMIIEDIQNASQKTSTSAAPTMNQAAIRKLVADSVAAALETQVPTMENTENTNRNTRPRETHVRERALQLSVLKGKQQCPQKNILAKGQERSQRSECSHREKGHYNCQCSKANNNAHRRTYLLRDKNAHRDPNVVMGTFLLNQHLARVLFDSVADKSFVSISLASMLNILPITLDTTYNIEMADGNLVSTNTVIQVCTLALLNKPFKIDLMSIKHDSFNVVIGMDRLSKYHAKILSDEKVVHIPINDETLII